MKYPIISVVVINKGDRGIKDTLDALMKLDYTDKEVVVVDASQNKLDDIRDSHPTVKWIDYPTTTSKKYTIPEQRNVGVQAALGKILVFTDANCIPEQDWLSKLVKPILEENESIVSGATLSRGKKTLHDDASKTRKKYLEECPTINLAFTREVYEKVGGFDERFDYGSDVDFSWRVIGAGYKVRFEPHAIVRHNWGPKSQDFKREYLYGQARARLHIKHAKFKHLFMKDTVTVLYPLFLVGLPLTFVIPWYPLLLLLLVFKNIRHHPIRVVSNHLVYGCGVLREIGHALFSKNFREARKLKILFASTALFAASGLSLMSNPPIALKPFIFFALILGPGTLISYLLKLPNNILWPLRAALGIFFLMLTGLATNTLLPLLKVTHPLSPKVYIPILLATTIILTFFGLRSKINYAFPGRKQVSTLSTKLLHVAWGLLPVMAAMGATRLTNKGGVALPVGTLVFLAILSLISLAKKNSPGSLYKWGGFCTGLAIIFLYSLRGIFANGWDVQAELHVLNLTLSNQQWSLGLEKDAYNATLSLTILPTLLGGFLHATGDTIYKLYYPIFSALSIPVIYAIARKFLSSRYAFLASLFYVSQAQFMQQLPAICRQQVAFLFFTLFLYFSFTHIRKHRKNTLFLILGLGLILSHYSTAYVTLVVLFSGGVVRWLIKQLLRRNRDLTSTLPGIGLVIILFLFTLLWYGQIANQTTDLTKSLRKTMSSLIKGTAEDSRSLAAQQALTGPSSKSLNSDIVNYQKDSILGNPYLPLREKQQIIKDFSVLEPKNTTIQYPRLKSAIDAYNRMLQIIFKASLLLGVLIFILNHIRKQNKESESDLLSLALASVLLLFALLVLPNISKNYNIERLYQQLLPILAVPTFLFLMITWQRLKIRTIGVFLSLIFVMSYLFSYIGLFNLWLGGGPSLQFNNYGPAYEQFYTYDGEELAANRLRDTTEDAPLSTDTYGKVKLDKYFNKDVNISDNVYTAVLSKKPSYIFLTYNNQVLKKAYEKKGNSTLIVEYPLDLINSRKNLIYTNSDSVIYK